MKVVIIAGCQRSGTTLTGQIIGAHPQGFLIDESDKLYQWTDAWLSAAKNQTDLLNHCIKAAAEKYSDVRSNFSTVADTSNLFLILKAPNLSFYADQIAPLQDDISVIYPIRDVRAVVASMLSLKHSKMIENQTRYFLENKYVCDNFVDELALLTDKKTAKHIKAALIWKVKSLLFVPFQNLRLNPLLIKYEDIITQTHSATLKIAEHCQIKYEKSLNAHHQVMTGNAPGKTLRNRKIDINSLQKWENQLEANQVSDIWDVAGETMQSFNYQDS